MKKCLLFLFVLFIGTSLMAQPANDNCADAVTIMLNEVVTYSTLMATTDGLTTTCLGVNDSIPADVWFTWTAPSTGSFNWTNCGTSDFDSRMAVYANAAACPPTDAELVGCNDDGDTAACPNFGSSISFPATMGTVYTMRLGGFQNNPDTLPTMGSGTAVITQLPDGPPNDFCSNAIPITLGEVTNFTNINGINDGPGHPGNSSCFAFGQPFVEGDVWYTYTADFDGTVIWETCGSINFDSRMVVYNPGVTCTPVQSDLYACNDDSGCPDYHSSLDFEVTNGNTYLMQIGGYTGSFGNGTFVLDKFDPPTPPDNDDCANADFAFVITPEEADMQMDGIFFGTTVNASSEADFAEPRCATFNPGGDFNDVWYVFNTAGNTELEIRFSPIILVDGAFYVDLYEVCGTQDSLLMGGCFTHEDGESVRDTITGLPATPTEYLMRVTTRLTSETPGDFFFQIVGNTVSSIDDLAVVEGLTIAPNPTNDLANVDFSLTENKQLALTITNSVGAIVQHQSAQNYQAGNHRIELNMADLPSGIYFVSVNDGKAAKIEKLVKL